MLNDWCCLRIRHMLQNHVLMCTYPENTNGVVTVVKDTDTNNYTCSLSFLSWTLERQPLSYWWNHTAGPEVPKLLWNPQSKITSLLTTFFPASPFHSRHPWSNLSDPYLIQGILHFYISFPMCMRRGLVQLYISTMQLEHTTGRNSKTTRAENYP